MPNNQDKSQTFSRDIKPRGNDLSHTLSSSKQTSESSEKVSDQQSGQLDDAEINRLRDVVLSWVEKKKEINATPPTTPNAKPPLPTKNDVIKNLTAPAVLKKSGANEPPKSSPVKPNKKLIKRRVIKILVLLLVLIITTIAGFGGWLYYTKNQNQLTKAVTKFLPYPIALVNWQPLYYYTWQDQVETLWNFYQRELTNNPDLEIPTPLETKQHILNRMVDLALMYQLAKDYGITISPMEVEEQIQSLVTEIGSQQALETQLKDLYNWSLADFKHEIIEPLILKSKLSLAITLDDRLNQKARSTMQEILDKLKNGQRSFEELAQEYSEDITAMQGGDLGYFSRGQMVKEFEEAAFNLEPNKISEVVKTQFGYHIIKVEEQLFDENGELTQVRAKHILIRGKDFNEFFEELKNQAKIWKFIKI